MLQLEKISVFYDHICALREVSLRVDSGEIVALIGANGAGKTTLLLTLSGILKPKSGRILFEGKQDLMNLAPEKIVQLGIVHSPEGRGIFHWMSVEENLRIGAFLVGNRSIIAERKEQVYTYFPVLKERRTQMAGTLSGGEAQMLSIGRALMAAPTLLLLDEPSAGLAPRIVDQIFEIIEQINRDDVTVLLVEQNATRALAISHRAYVLEVGCVVRSGPAQTLLNDPAVQQAYLGR